MRKEQFAGLILGVTYAAAALTSSESRRRSGLCRIRSGSVVAYSPPIAPIQTPYCNAVELQPDGLAAWHWLGLVSGRAGDSIRTDYRYAPTPAYAPALGYAPAYLRTRRCLMRPL